MKQKPCNDDMFHIKLGNSKEKREFFTSQKNWVVPAQVACIKILLISNSIEQIQSSTYFQEQLQYGLIQKFSLNKFANNDCKIMLAKLVLEEFFSVAKQL